MNRKSLMVGLALLLCCLVGVVYAYTEAEVAAKQSAATSAGDTATDLYLTDADLVEDTDQRYELLWGRYVHLCSHTWSPMDPNRTTANTQLGAAYQFIYWVQPTNTWNGAIKHIEDANTLCSAGDVMLETGNGYFAINPKTETTLLQAWNSYVDAMMYYDSTNMTLTMALSDRNDAESCLNSANDALNRAKAYTCNQNCSGWWQ